MIDIKMMARKRVANGTGAAKTTTGGSVVYQQNVDEARHAQQADKAIFAEQANKALEANVAARASYANKAQELAEDSTAFSQFLRKDKDDTAQKLITFLEGIGLKDGHGITAEGMATLLEVVSTNFNEAEQRGFAIHRRADGKYQLSLTDIIVWGKAAFNELEKRKLSYVGGNFVFSACGSKIKRVVDNGTTWRCYFHQDDGTTATTNLWEVDDQARCQTFNIRAGVYAGVSNRSYWRRVMAKGIDYIDLSKTDCEQGSDAPQVDDALVQMGNKTKPERQGLIMLRTTGEPAIIIYSDINDYTLEGKSVALLSPSKVDISASIFRLLSPSGSAIDLKGKDGRDGKSSYTFTRYSDDGGKTLTSIGFSRENHIVDFAVEGVGGKNTTNQLGAEWKIRPFKKGKIAVWCVVKALDAQRGSTAYFQASPVAGIPTWDTIRTGKMDFVGTGLYLMRNVCNLPNDMIDDSASFRLRLDNFRGTFVVLECGLYDFDSLSEEEKDLFTNNYTDGVNQLNTDLPFNITYGGNTVKKFNDGTLPNGAGVGFHVHNVKSNYGVFILGQQFVFTRDGNEKLFLTAYMRANRQGHTLVMAIENRAGLRCVLSTEWQRFQLITTTDGRPHALTFYGDEGDFDICCLQFGMGTPSQTWQPAFLDKRKGTMAGTYLGIASWDKPYPPLDPQMYQWSSTTDKEAMKKAQEAIKAAETASSAATSAATKANDATKRAGEVELKMEQGEFIVRADKTRFQNNKGQDVAVFNADGTINARAIMAKGTGGTAYFGLYNDAPAMIFTNASGQTTALMTNQGILKPADCIITLRDTKGSMLFKETNGTTIRAYFTYYIAIRVVNTGFQRTLFGDDTLSPHAQLSLSARFEEYAGSDMLLRCVEPKWIEPQKEQTIVYRATTDHLYPKRYLSAETEFRVSWYAAFEGKIIVAGNFNAREAASKDQGYVSFDY